MRPCIATDIEKFQTLFGPNMGQSFINDDTDNSDS